MFKIESLNNKVVKAGKLTDVETFIIVDEAGAFVSGTKEYDTREAAQEVIDGLGNYAEGLAFAKAAFPDQAEKAQIGKANVIAEYLSWIAGGRQVKEAKPAAEPTSGETAEAEPAAPASEVEEF